jgi:crooked neck
VERAGAVYDKCLEVIPHAKFTFPMIWMYKAELEIRRKRLDAARKVLGTAIGKCPKEKIFKGYIDLEFRVCCSCTLASLFVSCASLMP